MVGLPHRAQIVQFELFELFVLLELDQRFSIEQFEPTVSQSTVPPPPPLNNVVRPPLPQKYATPACPSVLLLSLLSLLLLV